MRKLLLSLFILIGLITGATHISKNISHNSIIFVERAHAQGESVECDDSFVREKNDLGEKTRNCTLAERITDEDGFVYPAWVVMRTIINIVLILALLAIAFSNITRINIDTYTIKKALPNLLIGVVLANASLFIIRYLADISTVIIQFFVEQAGGGTFESFVGKILGIIGIESLLTALDATKGAAIVSIPIILLVLGIIIIIGMLWFALILFIRLAAIYLLTIVAPIAFIAYGIPGQEKWFKQWWQQFIKWLFILPAMSAVFWIMLEIGKAGDASVVKTMIMYVLFFFAMTIPSKLGGKAVDKATNFFKNNPISKGITNEAKLRGEQAMANSPIGRIQARNELRKKNIEDSIKAAKTKHGRAVRMKTTGTGKDRKTKLTKAGKREAELGEIIKGYENELEEAKNAATDNFYNDPENRVLLDKLRLKEIYKNNAEKRADLAKKNHIIDSDDDEKIKHAIEELASVVAKEEVFSGEIKRQEGINNGNAMNTLYQVPQILTNYMDSKKHKEFLEERIKGESGDKADETRKEIEVAEKHMSATKFSYDQMRADNKAHIGELDLNNTDIETAHQLLDKDSNFAKTNIKASKLLAGQQRQALKSFNAGVTAQIKDEVKEQTVPQLQRELEDYLNDTLGDEKFLKKAQEFIPDITHDDIKKAYFEGDTALLSGIGLADHEVRNGLVISEKFKTIHKSVNDIRHSDALTTWMETSNTATRAAGDKKEIFSPEDIEIAKSGSVQQKKIASAKATSNGPQAGSPGIRQQKGENTDTKDRDYTKKNGGNNQGGGGSGTNAGGPDPDDEIIDDEPEEEPEADENEDGENI